ncbi:hypothetical protein P691DRAFT_282226 [Macrolepiota fuliginosa MF-IS2]|uniref:Uncharacterized protein n=1 Tax=Macrolepiota fuliginosa MF-IS2 TaxID=1400762 RepID=A0A9P5X8V1_9AGAR|nr:hypothetical protein P691DRAFT_282226 [Macrolepiota fuliginosa MF-IS2]
MSAITDHHYPGRQCVNHIILYLHHVKYSADYLSTSSHKLLERKGHKHVLLIMKGFRHTLLVIGPILSSSSPRKIEQSGVWERCQWRWLSFQRNTLFSTHP